MSNSLIELIRQGASFAVQYNPFGEPRTITISSGDSSTSVSSQNEHFAALLEYLKYSKSNLSPDIQWVAPVHDKSGALMSYQTNLGDFVASSNFVTDYIALAIKSRSVEVRPANDKPAVIELEISVFLPRHYTLFGAPNTRVEHFDVGAKGILLPFPSQVHLLSTIEPDYFSGNEFLRQHIKNGSGNVIRLVVDRKGIAKVFKWSKPFIGSDSVHLRESMRENIALHKRSPSQGPTTQWYFDWMTLQQYIWAPTLEVTNKLIDRINCQAHRKTTGFFSRDDLGDNVSIRARMNDGSVFLWPLSSLRDEQISLFPFEFDWKYHPVHNSLHRVRFLLDRGLYFEAIVVAQAVLEGLVNAMFTPDTSVKGKTPKWETKYRWIRQFIGELDDANFLKQSALNQYLNGGLQRIYELRNRYAHDIFEKQPEYEYQSHLFDEVRDLLKPMTDTWESNRFLSEIDELYRLNAEFRSFRIRTDDERRSRKDLRQKIAGLLKAAMQWIRRLVTKV